MTARVMDLQPLKIDRAEPVRSSRRRERRWVAPAVGLALVAAVVWLFQAQILSFVDGLRLPEVSTYVVRKSDPAAAAAATGASSNGYIVAKTRAALSADTPGRIVQMNVEEGSVVKKGDIVARLYSDEYAAYLRRAEAELGLAMAGKERARAEVKVAEDDLARLRSAERSAVADLAAQQAELALAEIELRRATKLLEDRIDTEERRDKARTAVDAGRAQVDAAQARLDTAGRAAVQGESQLAVAVVAEKEAQARVDAAVAARDQAKATLEKTEVRAPFDGIVVLKDAEVGEVVSPNVQGGSNARGSVVTMVDFASLEVEAEVPETNLSAVVVGRPAKIFLDAFPDKPYPGRVDRIWPTANRTKATVEVRVAFLDRDDKLRPEMGVRVVFESGKAKTPPGDSSGGPADGAAAGSSVPVRAEDEAPVLLVPLEALVKTGGQQGVFVLERDRVRFQTLALGSERGGKVVAREGLSEGDRIVIGAPVTLEDGDRVKLKD